MQGFRADDDADAGFRHMGERASRGQPNPHFLIPHALNVPSEAPSVAEALEAQALFQLLLNPRQVVIIAGELENPSVLNARSHRDFLMLDELEGREMLSLGNRSENCRAH